MPRRNKKKAGRQRKATSFATQRENNPKSYYAAESGDSFETVTVEVGGDVHEVVQIGPHDESTARLFVCKATGVKYRTSLHAKDFVKETIRRVRGKKYYATKIKRVEISKGVWMRMPQRGSKENTNKWRSGEYPSLYALCTRHDNQDVRECPDPRSIPYELFTKQQDARVGPKKIKKRLKQKKSDRKKKEKQENARADHTETILEKQPQNTFDLADLLPTDPSPSPAKQCVNAWGVAPSPPQASPPQASPPQASPPQASPPQASPPQASPPQPPLDPDSTKTATHVADITNTWLDTHRDGTSVIRNGWQDENSILPSATDEKVCWDSGTSRGWNQCGHHTNIGWNPRSDAISDAIPDAISDRWTTKSRATSLSSNDSEFVVPASPISIASATSGSSGWMLPTGQSLTPPPLVQPHKCAAPFSSSEPTMDIRAIECLAQDLHSATLILCETKGWGSFYTLPLDVQMKLVFHFKLHQHNEALEEYKLTIASFSTEKPSRALLQAIGFSEPDAFYITDLLSKQLVACDCCSTFKLRHQYFDFQLLERMAEGKSVWCIACCTKKKSGRHHHHTRHRTRYSRHLHVETEQ